MAITKEEVMQECFSVSTAVQYDRFTLQNKMPQTKEDLPGGGSVLWFGSPSAKRVLTYIPGGGLVMYASVFHIGLAHSVYEAASTKGNDVAVAILAYETCLTAPYPAQLSQLVALVTQLLRNKSAEDIELFGDSTGGLMINALLLHVQHPHPLVPKLSIEPEQRFGRVLLISPAAPLVTASVGTSEKIGRDLVTVENLKQLWTVIEANHHPEVELINPWLTPAYIMYEDWYSDLPVGKITIIVGELEIMGSEIDRLSRVIKYRHQSGADIVFVNGAGHAAFVADGLMGMSPCEYTLQILRWAGL